MVPLSNGDSACWRPAWGGVRLCGNDLWVHMIFGEWCRFAQDDTVGDRGVVPNMFGVKYSTVNMNDMAFFLADIVFYFPD